MSKKWYIHMWHFEDQGRVTMILKRYVEPMRDLDDKEVDLQEAENNIQKAKNVCKTARREFHKLQD